MLSHYALETRPIHCFMWICSISASDWIPRRTLFGDRGARIATRRDARRQRDSRISELCIGLLSSAGDVLGRASSRLVHGPGRRPGPRALLAASAALYLTLPGSPRCVVVGEDRSPKIDHLVVRFSALKSFVVFSWRRLPVRLEPRTRSWPRLFDAGAPRPPHLRRHRASSSPSPLHLVDDRLRRRDGGDVWARKVHLGNVERISAPHTMDRHRVLPRAGIFYQTALPSPSSCAGGPLIERRHHRHRLGPASAISTSSASASAGAASAGVGGDGVGGAGVATSLKAQPAPVAPARASSAAARSASSSTPAAARSRARR